MKTTEYYKKQLKTNKLQRFMTTNKYYKTNNDYKDYFIKSSED